MIQEFRTNGLRWVHVIKPDDRDIEHIRGVFEFHPLVMENIIAPTFHPFVEDFESHLFLILHFPMIYRGRQANKIAEVDFLVAKDILVTITYLEFSRLDEIFLSFQRKGDAQPFPTKTHSGFLLYHIIDGLFHEHIKDLEFLEKEVTKIEDKIFQKHRRLTVEDISHVRRDILDFRKPFKSQATVLTSFREKAERFYGKPISPYLLDLSVTEDRIRNLIENQKEMMDVLYETHTSLMSSHLSRIITTLTLFSAIILPLSFLSSLWGMNQKVMPLRDGPHDFWIVIGLMAIIALLLLWYFHRKRWL